MNRNDGPSPVGYFALDQSFVDILGIRADIDKYASWLDADMKPGLTSESVYVPGQGLALTYQGQVKGTIPGNTFAQMYYRYNVGEKADKKIRKGLLGL